ncbi:MAG TPA: L-2-hydroxyglutarate oxidase, partial [Pirellulales bacterium]
EPGELVLETTRGAIRTRALVGCAGLQSDRIARLCGLEPRLQIVPFRGEYYELTPAKHGLIKNLVYPVPDPRFPFLGVHFTRMIHGGVEAGPNAVLAFAREGYSWGRFSLRDCLQMLGFPGFWKMGWKHWRMGGAEFRRSLSKAVFVRDLQRLLPELKAEDVTFRGAGVRAQAVERDGTLVDDFRIVSGDRMIHVLNAPSPAATASLAIGRTIAAQAVAAFDWR